MFLFFSFSFTSTKYKYKLNKYYIKQLLKNYKINPKKSITVQGQICEDKGQQEHWRRVSLCATVTSDAWVHEPPPMKDKNQWIGNAFFPPSFLHRRGGVTSPAKRKKNAIQLVLVLFLVTDLLFFSSVLGSVFEASPSSSPLQVVGRRLVEGGSVTVGSVR